MTLSIILLWRDRIKMKPHDLYEFKSVRNWIKSVKENSRRGQLSKSTEYNYLSTMARYIKYVKVDPDTLLEEARKNPDKAKERITEYFNYLIKERGLTFNSARTLCHATLRGFYTHNGINFGKWRAPATQPSKVREIDESPANQVLKFDEETREIYVDKEVLQKFLNKLSFRDRTIALCLLSTSQDAVDLFKLNVGFVRQQTPKKNPPPRLFWRGTRSKTNEKFATFFSKEATRYVRQYVSTEREDADDNEPLFISDVSYVRRKNVNNKDNRMTVLLLDKNFRAAAKELGLINGNHYNPFRPKRFRHIFKSACTRAGIDLGFVHCFMGHKSSISEQYLEKPRAVLEAEYVKVEPFLTVFTTPEQEAVEELNELLKSTREELNKVQAETKDKILELQNKIIQQTEIISELSQKNRELESKFQELEDKIHEFLREILLDKLVDLSIYEELAEKGMNVNVESIRQRLKQRLVDWGLTET